MNDLWGIVLAFLMGGLSEHVKTNEVTPAKAFWAGFLFSLICLFLSLVPVWYVGDAIEERFMSVVILIVVASILIGSLMAYEASEGG